MTPDQRLSYILYTDIARSSQLSEQHESTYLEYLARHNELVIATVAQYDGKVYKQIGDGFIALFSSAADCLACACHLQQNLSQLPEITEGEPLLVRVVAHGGELTQVGPEYFGQALNRASRICQVCHAGQVIVSRFVADRASILPQQASLADLGQHHLRDLAEPEHLFQLHHPAFARQEFPPLETLESRPNNLVEQPGTFIGREHELGELSELLAREHRLVSIIAPGGYGKSRLAAQLCANLLGQYTHGAFMALLAPVRDHEHVITEVARALSFQFSSGRDPRAQLLNYLRPKQLLLCLDNFEHVLEATDLVAAILGAAPQVKIVVTSREPIRLRGELIFRLDPLSVAEQKKAQSVEFSDAELLFADRAQLVNPGLVPDVQASKLIGSICAQLSGIPLAIELAAAWADSLTLQELRDELEQWLELEARAADVPLRHRSLRACLDWSWELMGREQQQLLMQVSAFRGGFFTSACADMLGMRGMQLRGALARLVDKSWLYTREVHGQTRYFIRDMLAHEYTFAKLQATRQQGQGREEPEARESLYQYTVMGHARYFAGLAARCGPGLHSVRQEQTLNVLGLEQQNIYEALDTLQRRLGPQAGYEEEVGWLLLLILKYSYEYLAVLGTFRDMKQACSRLLDQSEKYPAASSFQVYALLIIAQADHRLGNIDEARQNFLRARELAEQLGEISGLANILQGLGNTEYVQGSHAQARRYYGEAQAIFRQLEYPPGVAATLGNLGNLDYITGNFKAARDNYSQSLELRTAAGDRLGMADSYYRLANVEHIQGDLAAAEQHSRQALDIFREIGNRHLVAFTLISLGQVTTSLGEHEQARSLLREATEIFAENGDRRGMATALVSLADVDLEQGRREQARRPLEESLEISREIGYHRGVSYALTRLAAVAYWQDELPRAAELLRESVNSIDNHSDFESLYASLVLAGRILLKGDRLHTGAMCLYCADRIARQSEYAPDTEDMRLLEEGLVLIETTVSSPEELAELKTQAVDLSTDRLVELILTELRDLAPDSNNI